MISFVFNQRILLAAAFIGLVFGFHQIAAKAQSAPEIWMTWRANSYVPAEFTGKAMPIEATTVTVSFEVVDGGRFANLSGHTIYWYLNDELIKSGVGTQQVSFRAPIRGNHDIRVKVNNYNGTSLVKTLEISAIRPEAVVVAKFPKNIFSSQKIQVMGMPYFFNVTKQNRLDFSWEVNGQRPISNQDINFLDIDLGGIPTDGFKLNIDLSISSRDNAFIGGSDVKTLIFKK